MDRPGSSRWRKAGRGCLWASLAAVVVLLAMLAGAALLVWLAVSVDYNPWLYKLWIAFKTGR